MSDPLNWSFPLGRLFGINLRVHAILPLVMLGLVLRATTREGTTVTILEALGLMFCLFLSILLHEFGHCFAARAVEGDAHEILLWPLGGLAQCDIPHTPRAHLLTALGGPAVNFVLCIFTGGALAFAGLVPPLHPVEAPYQPRLYHWRDGVYRTAHPPSRLFEATARTKETAAGPRLEVNAPNAATASVSPPVLLNWQIAAAQLFWVNWFLLLINLLPGFPLDGGRILQAALWARGNYASAMITACYAGFGIMIAIVLYSMVSDSVFAFALALIIYVCCRQQMAMLETQSEENTLGYDFSQGYTSLEGPSAPTARPRRIGWYQRWLQRRATRRALREQEEREAEEQRMDELLAKVQREGIHSLSDEERRFLNRVSARYRGNKS